MLPQESNYLVWLTTSGLQAPRCLIMNFFQVGFIFYGDPGVEITHVGIYIGRSMVIHAPTFGRSVEIERYRWTGDAYAGVPQPWRSSKP